jgi:hypothetical protein
VAAGGHGSVRVRERCEKERTTREREGWVGSGLIDPGDLTRSVDPFGPVGLSPTSIFSLTYFFKKYI